MEKGNRVGAIFLDDCDDGLIYLFGFGKYLNEEIPISAEGEISNEAKKMQIPVPKIELDDGKIIYGCECWIGPETEVKRLLKDKKVKRIDIDDLRSRYRSHFVN